MSKSVSPLKFCPRCQNKRIKSRIYLQGTVRTALAPAIWWDEDGELHAHDPNVLSSKYMCGRGHQWEETETGTCWCGWKGGE